MRRNAIFRMILFAFLAVVLVGVLIAGIALKVSNARRCGSRKL